MEHVPNVALTTCAVCLPHLASAILHSLTADASLTTDSPTTSLSRLSHLSLKITLFPF